MIFKTTLLMSNPQVIRVFELDAEGEAKTITRAVEAVHEWNMDCGLTIWRNDKVITHLSDVTIKELFSEETKDDVWELRLEGGTMRTLDREEQWVFRLEVEDYRENDHKEEVPRLLRYRGLNPDYSFGAVRTWNQCVRQLMGGGSIYIYNKGYIGEEAYSVNSSSIRNKLLRAIRTDLKQVEINYQWTMPLRSMMEWHTVNEMKKIIDDNELDINMYQRKANLVADLTEYFDDPHFWIRILEGMTMEEYESFSNCVQKNERHLENNGTFLRYGITLGENSPHKGYLPSEFLSFYENFLLEVGDEDILERKKAQEVMVCAYTLYGVFDFDTLCKLAMVMYPELDADQAMGEQWDYAFFGLTTVEQNRNGEQLGEIQVMYDFLNIKEGNAKKYWRTRSEANIPYYLPTKKEAFSIAREGLVFSENAERELRRLILALHDRYGYNQDDMIIADIYNMCHMNYKINEIVNTLMKRYRLSKQATKYQQLRKALQKYKGEVRQILFGGHTGEEAKILFHLEIKEEM